MVYGIASGKIDVMKYKWFFKKKQQQQKEYTFFESN